MTAGDAVPDADRGPLVRRFFELLEANAEDRWSVPDLGLGAVRSEPGDDNEAAGEVYESAYEGVTFQDSADDGEEGAVAEGGGPAPGEFALDGEAERAEDRLRFLAAVARLWRTAARAGPVAEGGPDRRRGDRRVAPRRAAQPGGPARADGATAIRCRSPSRPAASRG